MVDVDAVLQAVTQQIQALEQRIAEQQTLIEQQQAALSTLLAGQTAERSGRAGESSVQASERRRTRQYREARTTGGSEPSSKSSRRTLLKLGGAAAAATGVALVASEQTAHASPLSDGSSLLIGRSNTGEAATFLSFNGTGQLFGAMLEVDDGFTEGTGQGAAIAGLVDGSTSSLNTIGVLGASSVSSSTLGIFSSGIGVLGEANNGVGVWAVSNDTANGSPALMVQHTGDFDGADITGAPNQNGVKASVGGTSGNGVVARATGASGFGVWGQSDSGIGIVGSSTTGLDFSALGTGRILQNLQAAAGAPTAGSHQAGESIRDSNGELWLCVKTGTPGTFVKAAHALAGFAGGATSYLSKPVRLLDSRPGATDALHNGGGPYPTGSTNALTIAGDTFNGVTVPSSAVGAFGNVTVVTSAGANGYVAIVPHGAGFSGTSSVNYSSGGAVIANFFNVGLSGGAIDIIVGGVGSTDVIIDVFAVVA